MLVLIVLVAIVAAVILVRSQKRAALFVRAYLYLVSLEEGLSSEDANRVAMIFGDKSSDPDQDKRAIHAAKVFAQVNFGGKQLPLIAQARVKGFSG